MWIAITLIFIGAIYHQWPLMPILLAGAVLQTAVCYCATRNAKILQVVAPVAIYLLCQLILALGQMMFSTHHLETEWGTWILAAINTILKFLSYIGAVAVIVVSTIIAMLGPAHYTDTEKQGA